MITWFLIGLPVVGYALFGAWVVHRLFAFANEVYTIDQAEEDAEQAAYLAEWSYRHIAYQAAKDKGDTRLMHARWPALHEATNDRLRRRY